MGVKNKYGQYFTIDVIADFMTSLINSTNECAVLEPSCGKGVFIKNLIEHGFNNIVAVEIDKTLKTPYDFIRNESFISTPVEEKFDVVIGNPPYIRWKNLEKELKEELQGNLLWNKYFNSLCDYLFIFILKSIEQLNKGGELIFICTDYWMNTTHSHSLRNYMCENGYFSDIYHFKESPLFENVTASFVIFRYIKSSQKENTIRLYSYNKKGTPTKNDLDSRSCFDLSLIPQFQVNSRWILATQEFQNELNLFESCCVKGKDLFFQELYRLGDFCDIGNGMVSGLDAAFKYQAEDVLNAMEKDRLLPILKAKDLDRFQHKEISKYIFMQEGLSEDEFKKNYPHFHEHFQPYIEKLNDRYNYNKPIKYWEFVFPRNKKLFERQEDKIFVPCKERISHKKYFRFSLAPNGVFPLQDVTGILKKSTCKESIEYILAYLNSEWVFKWLCSNGIVKGEIVEFSEAPIASVPYRPINWNDENEVRLHSMITENTQDYLLDGKIEHLLMIKESFKHLFYV